MTVKTCIRCKQELSLDHFGDDTTARDGLRGICHACYRENVAYLTGSTDQRCAKCGKVAPIDTYGRSRKEPTGRYPTCGACNVAASAASRRRHPRG